MNAQRGFSRIAFYSALTIGALTGPCLAADNPAAAPPQITTNAPTGPSFQSAGLKLTLNSLAVSKDGEQVTISALLTNNAQGDTAVAFVGRGLIVDNRGNSFYSIASAGIASCGVSDRDWNVNNSAVKNTQDCITGKTLPFEQWTLLSKGQTSPGTFAFRFEKGDKSNRGLSFSFSIALAYYPADTMDATAKPDALSAPGTALPKPKPRLLSVGIISVPAESQPE
jgi:hypothetical protein